MANKTDARKHFQSAGRFFQEGNYIKASEEYQKATELDPQSADAYYNWGVALGNLQHHAEAMAKFQKATELDPQSADAYTGWGLALGNLQHHAEATAKFQKATELNPQSADGYYNWGVALGNLQQYAEAMAKYQKATELNPKFADAYFNWGNALSEQKQYAEAMAKYQQAIKADPASLSSVYAAHNIAFYLRKQGKYKQSWDHWEKARQAYERMKLAARDSSDANYFQNFGNLLQYNLGRLDQAEEIYNEGLGLSPDHVGILISLTGLYLEKQGQDDENIWKSIMSKDGWLALGQIREGIEPKSQRTIAYWKAREYYKKAEKLLEDQLSEEKDADTSRQLGELHLSLEEYEKAEKYLQSALEKDKDSATAYADLGVLYSNLEDHTKAVQYFKDAHRLDEDDLTVWSNLAEAYLKVKRVDQSEEEYQKILEIASSHVESHIGLGEVYTTMGDAGDGDMYEEALYYFTEGIKIGMWGYGSKRLEKKDLAAVFYSRGYARVKLYEASKTPGDESLLHMALEDFKECCKNDPDHHKARRAQEKLEKRLSRFYRHTVLEQVGPLLVVLLSLSVFVLSQVNFYSAILGKSMDVGYYALLTFVSLLFMVAGLSLTQLLKLKVAGIELEKSAVQQITTSGPLRIKK